MSRRVDELGAPVLGCLPQPEHGAGRIGAHRHAARSGDVDGAEITRPPLASTRPAVSSTDVTHTYVVQPADSAPATGEPPIPATISPSRRA